MNISIYHHYTNRNQQNDNTMKTKKIFIAAVLMTIPAASFAQDDDYVNHLTNMSRKEIYADYDRWSIGLHGGISSLWGDFSTFSDEKFYPAPIGSVSVSLQATPTLGFTLEGYFSYNKIGALSSNKNDYLNTNGFYSPTANNPLTGETFKQYQDLYSKVRLFQGRLGLDINLNNLFGHSTGQRRWTVIFSPSYYLQYYRPKVYSKSDDKRYTSRDLFYQNNSGVGAELALRYRASRIVDLQLKGGGAYGFNKKFDGIASDKKTNILAYVQVGVVFKLNGKTKKDNLLYAPTVPIEISTGPTRTQVQVVHDTVYVDRPVTQYIYRTNGWIPAVHFIRGKADLDDAKYATELKAIVDYLNANPEAKFDVLGWADHTGTEELNATLTQERAQALADYLVAHGISRSRIVNIEGRGKDYNLSGEDALSSQARRAEVVVK